MLVQLPGVDDPARAKELIGTAAVLEIVDVKEGPFPQPEAALAKHGGILPLARSWSAPSRRGAGEGEQWYLVARPRSITGREMRNARPGQDEFRKWETNFTLSPGRRPAVRALHGGQHRQQARGGPGQPDRQRGDHSVQNRGLGPHHRPGQRGGSVDLSRYLRSGSLPAGVIYNEERSIGPSLGADSIHQGIVAGLAGLMAVIAGHAGVLQALGR